MRAARLTGSLLVATGRDRAAPQDGNKISTLPTRPRPSTRPSRHRADGQTDVPLRINTARHLRLRLAAEHLGLSANGLMVVAIDRYIDNVLPKVPVGPHPFFEQGRAAAPGRASLSLIRPHSNRTS